MSGQRLDRRTFLSIAPTAAVALASIGLSRNVEATERATRKPLIILFLAGGPPAQEMTDPKPDAPAEFRGPRGSIHTRIAGVRFGEDWPRLAMRNDAFALLRGIETQTSEHHIATRYLAQAPEESRLLNEVAENRFFFGTTDARTLPGTIGSQASGRRIPYVYLNPNSEYVGARAFRPDATLTPHWDSRAQRFVEGAPQRPPVSEEQASERRDLLRRFDTSTPQSPDAEVMRRHYETAFELARGGGELSRAFTLDSTECERYGPPSFTRDIVVLGKQLVERASCSVVIYHDDPEPTIRKPQSWDLHRDVGGAMQRKAPSMDRAAAALIDDIRSSRLNAVLLMMGEISRTPRVNDAGGRDHWPHGNQAILAGGKIQAGVVHGSTNFRGDITDGQVQQRGQLGNTVMAACGLTVPSGQPVVREILRG